MMSDKNNQIVPIDQVIDVQVIDSCLTSEETTALEVYQKRGGRPLAQETAMAFFQLYLNGYDTKEIQRMNSAFALESINWARLQYNWDREKQLYVSELMGKIKEKTMKAQLDVTNFMTDLLAVTSKLHGTKLKKYLQTGNPKDLEGYMPIDSINSLVKLVEGLQKITGYNPPIKVQSEKNININVTEGTQGDKAVDQAIVADPNLSSDEAAQVLGIMAQSRRRRRNDSK